MSQGVDYAAVLHDLERRRAELKLEFDRSMAELEGAISFLKRMSSQIPSQANFFEHRQVSVTPRPSGFERLPYREKSIRDSAYECLSNNGKPMKTKAIADALIAGGLSSNAKHLANGVYSTLAREPGVFHVDGGWWELVEWKRSRAKDTEGVP